MQLLTPDMIYQVRSSSNYIAILTIISGIISESLRDPGFSIPSDEARLARKTAQKIEKYLLDQQNKASIKQHEVFLTKLFNMWTSIPPKTTQIREQIWKRFSQFTSSTDYITFWNGFYETIGIQNSHCSLILCHLYPFHPTLATQVPHKAGPA